MGRACAVPKCKTGYKEKCSCFRAPKNIAQFKKWQAAIPGIILKQSQRVCEKHFEPNCVLKEWVGYDSEGRIIAKMPYLRPRLVEYAVPTIFDNLTTSVPPVSDKPTDSVFVGSNSLEDQCKSFEEPVIDTPDAECASESRAMHEVLRVTPVLSDTLASSNQEVVDSASIVRRPNFVLSKITINDATSNVVMSEKNAIVIPTSWGVTEYAEERGQRVVFSNILRTNVNGIISMVIDKSVEIEADKTLRYCAHGRLIDSERCQLPTVLTDTTLLPKTLETFRRLNICQGLGPVNNHYLSVDCVFQDSVQRWRDNNCTILTKEKRCEHCKKMRKRTLQRESRAYQNENIHRIRHLSNPIDRKKLIALGKKISGAKRVNSYLKRRVKSLTESLKGKAKEISSIRAEALDEKFSQFQIPASQQTAIKEIISAAMRKDTKSRRYSEDWIMLCILMQIRSPSYYEFLRNNDVLPLPCTRTIRSYFSLINVKCGFDEQFGLLLKKHFDTKTEQQRHGVLLLDEINLRKSVAVCSRNLSYVGLTDLGEDGPQSTDIQEQATHGLVLMFQSIADSFNQPIAVFASKNSVKGDELAKHAIKAITFLEKNGAIIHGVIADGAATNAKMWTILGVSGEMENPKTYFTHPLDNDRKVFVFSDIPHVVKNIRNWLYNNKKLRMKSSDNYISWDYFKMLFDIDSKHPGHARACPKLTLRHVLLDSISKMRVRLATQIFSNSVAQGLAFYLSQKVECFAGCDETIQFCTQVNRMFDALNRKSSNEGLAPETNDFKVLQDSITWLDEWESAKKKGDITADEFLTWQTSQALRLSLYSTIDLCRYLIDNFGFKYLLTGKVNQDNLEKFFGTIRQAAGCNDHPSCPTFLQLYKVLSVYSIIKPPKFGNCTVLEQTSPKILVSLQELKDIYGPKSEGQFIIQRRNVKNKLDDILRQHDLEVDEIIDPRDHDYALSKNLDCIIYYVTGFSFFN